tara:strand:- start:2575 stop:2952 length:378 start_codon:yes stop_codon:yes gene_type:complete
MFGISNYVFILFGLFLIVGSLWDYKVYNPLAWGNTRNKKGIFKKISPVLFKINNIIDYQDGLIGVILCLIGIYGIINDIVNDIHEKDDKDLSYIAHKKFDKDISYISHIFDKDKGDKEDKEETNN